MTSGSFASNSVETVRLLDPTCHNFRTLSVRNPRNRVTKYPLFLRNTLTPAPRNNVARYSLELLRMEFRRFLHLIVLLPVQIVRSGRRIIYRIMGYNNWLKDFFATWQHLRRMAPA